MKKAAVVFDVGSTLVHPDMGRLAAFAGTDLKRNDISVVGRAFTYAAEADLRVRPGEDPAARQGEEFLRNLDGGHAQDRDECRRMWVRIAEAARAGATIYTELDPDSHAVLACLRREGHILIAASNSDGTLEDELLRFGIRAYFDAVVDSHLISLEKPDPRFYQHVLSLLPEPEDRLSAWYVGNDVLRDVLGSVVSGFHNAILYDRWAAYPSLSIRNRIATLKEVLDLVRTTGRRS